MRPAGALAGQVRVGHGFTLQGQHSQLRRSEHALHHRGLGLQLLPLTPCHPTDAGRSHLRLPWNTTCATLWARGFWSSKMNHVGRITAESTGEGASFTVRIPIA